MSSRRQRAARHRRRPVGDRGAGDTGIEHEQRQPPGPRDPRHAFHRERDEALTSAASPRLHGICPAAWPSRVAAELQNARGPQQRAGPARRGDPARPSRAPVERERVEEHGEPQQPHHNADRRRRVSRSPRNRLAPGTTTAASCRRARPSGEAAQLQAHAAEHAEAHHVEQRDADHTGASARGGRPAAARRGPMMAMATAPMAQRKATVHSGGTLARDHLVHGPA